MFPPPPEWGRDSAAIPWPSLPLRLIFILICHPSPPLCHHTSYLSCRGAGGATFQPACNPKSAKSSRIPIRIPPPMGNFFFQACLSEVDWFREFANGGLIYGFNLVANLLNLLNFREFPRFFSRIPANFRQVYFAPPPKQPRAPVLPLRQSTYLLHPAPPCQGFS